MATFDQWQVAYDVVYRALPATSDLACPNCGQRTLRIVFTAQPAANAGYVSFWCDTCLEGIHESLTGALYLDKPDELAAYQRVWRGLDALALSEEDSTDMIKRIAGEMRHD